MLGKFLVFDVESVGLDGEGFAVGAVVVCNGKIESEFFFACDPDDAKGGEDGRDWVDKNYPVTSDRINCRDAHEVRVTFSLISDLLVRQDYILVADCPHPVESKFLTDCVRSGARERAYPLIDIASMKVALGMDPLEKVDRLEREKPEHDPLCDARLTARELIGLLQEASYLQTIQDCGVKIKKEDSTKIWCGSPTSPEEVDEAMRSFSKDMEEIFIKARSEKRKALLDKIKWAAEKWAKEWGDFDPGIPGIPPIQKGDPIHLVIDDKTTEDFSAMVCKQHGDVVPVRVFQSGLPCCPKCGLLLDETPACPESPSASPSGFYCCTCGKPLAAEGSFCSEECSREMLGPPGKIEAPAETPLGEQIDGGGEID